MVGLLGSQGPWSNVKVNTNNLI